MVKTMPDAPDFHRIVVLGGGAWGTALALVASRAGRESIVWARDADAVAAINGTSTNPVYLPGITFTDQVTATADVGIIAAADVIIASVPAQSMRSVLMPIAHLIRPMTPIVSAAKGLERDTRATMSRVIAETVPHARPAVLSGPSFASDVARGLPTALTIAAGSAELAEQLAQSLASTSFRPYATTDVIGVELGGALKNVIAIAAGIVVGARLGASAQAALTARGFAELSRLGARLGAQPATLMGLSGLGDLVLSTGSTQSRNFALGHAIGEGGDIARLTGAGAKLAEGAFTASVAIELGASVGLELPIAEAVADVLSGRLAIAAAVERLMTRPLRSEGV
jgi:glycerol-3-phosphate dehydrogenase (NAD(P)+)